ncbi:YjbH domain-containing protein [Vibrio furnissii]|uniref:YjbH domain-containing protein n=1 Tax=Vibrio furnissii TaxID=29494 RepID=UPI0023DAF200|nr:YjbH domain-containing protein [Vibrio furnissii]
MTHSVRSSTALAFKLSAVCIGLFSGTFSSALLASTLTPVALKPSQSDFGGVGLMQMPSGRMTAEGEFNFGVNVNDDYQHFYTSIQLFPWLESTIRYTRVPDMLYNANPDYSGDNLYTDKGIDVKLRLFEEGYWLPETSIGIRDIGGTGLFDGEFIAATKRFGNLDVTLGMGWGYVGQSGNITNPLCKASDSFCERSTETKESGGSIDAGRWFHGPAALFGGIEYQTPYDPLRIKVEYDANDYSQDFPHVTGGKPMTQHTPWNFGVLYRLGDWGDAKVSYQRGDTFTVGLNLYTNFDQIEAIWRDEPKMAVTARPVANPNWDEVSEQLASNAGYEKNTIRQDGDTLIITGQQTKYRDREEAQDRAAAILANHAPESIRTYKIVEQRNGVDLTEAEIPASGYKKVANHDYIGANMSDVTTHSEPSTRASGQQLAQTKQRWGAGISPVLQQSFGGPESFYLYQIGFNTNANVWLTNNLEASGSIYVNLADNYDKFNYVENNPHISNFAVPRVRTMFRAYVHDNPVRLNNLQLTWFEQPLQQVYTQAYAGYLETMFAGVGGEVLYRPLNSNWAIGVDANLISQRDPDSWFGIYSDPYVYYDGYNASNCSTGDVSCQAYVLDQGTTGQITTYYTPQWEWIDNTLFKVSVGKFLGGDKGVRVDFSKQFKSGVIVGAFATVTDLTTEEYGEGSYNKGFYVSVPFDIMTIKPSTSRANIAWQPITRDGGQMLGRKYHLYDLTDARSPWFERKSQVSEAK